MKYEKLSMFLMIAIVILGLTGLGLFGYALMEGISEGSLDININTDNNTLELLESLNETMSKVCELEEFSMTFPKYGGSEMCKYSGNMVLCVDCNEDICSISNVVLNE